MTYTHLTDKEHASQKTMYTGQFDRVEVYNAFDGSSVKQTQFNHSPALLKIVDEPLVNTSDVAQRNPKKVKNVKVNIDETSGEISIYNDGVGIPIELHKDFSAHLGRDVYIPEMIFGHLRTGENFSGGDNNVGGTNGLGVKLTGIHSDYLFLEISCGGKTYSQRFSDILGNIEKPEIKKKKVKEYVKLTFKPLYKKFGYKLNTDDFKEFINVLKLRTFYHACYLKSLGCKVHFQEEEVKVPAIKDMLKMYVDYNDAIHFKVESGNDFMEVAVAVAPKAKTVSVINGVVVSKGSHFDHIRKLIHTDGKAHLWMFIVGSFSTENCWDSQSKDSIKLPVARLNKYNFDAHTAKYKSLAKIIASITEAKDLKKVVNSRVDKKITYDKYTKAKKNGPDNNLFVAEGDSAISLLRAGLSIKGGEYSYDNTGLFSLGGVPINVAKTSVDDNESGTIDGDDEDSDDIKIATKKFWETKIFSALVQVLGLKANNVYKTKKDLSSLPYKRIIICVDQDVDGRGNICPLVLQMFHSFWPSLYKLGFIQQWNSPIIRLVTKTGAKTVAEFKHETDLDKWIKNNDLSKVDVKYIKGLATHGNKYIPDMFKNFTKNTFTHSTDRNTARSFNLYYSPHERVARKEILATQVDHLTDEEKSKIDKSGKMSCNRYLDLESKTFMQAAMKRTLKGLDGLTPVRRKILTLMIKHNHTKPMKVFQVGGQTAYEMNYHHGDMSMNGAIIKMAQDYLGSNFFPLLKKEGQFGSRNRKGKDHGSPRYIEVALNVDIVKSIINKDDLYVLPKIVEDGSEFEPQYYVPTVPLCILEANKSVSYAWTLQNVGRDLKSVYEILKNMALGKKVKNTSIPANTKGYKGTIEIEGNVVTMRGAYTRNGSTITITELPLNLTPAKYAESLMLQDTYFSSVDNYSNDNIDIVITLVPGALVKIQSDSKYKNKNDPLFSFLGLEQTITENLNFINEDDVVEHFDSVFAVIKRCFELNKVKYENRINRELLLLKWIILREENILSYINSGDNKKVVDKNEEDANKIMKSGKYKPVNTTVLNTHSQYTTSELKEKLESVTIDIGYKYLGSIRNCDTYKESLKTRKESLKKYKERYDKLKKMEGEKPFMGASMYIEELDATYKAL